MTILFDPIEVEVNSFIEDLHFRMGLLYWDCSYGKSSLHPFQEDSSHEIDNTL